MWLFFAPTVQVTLGVLVAAAMEVAVAEDLASDWWGWRTAPFMNQLTAAVSVAMAVTMVRPGI